jgi:glycosyltransferase involved in cell wall biosynthesis
MRILFPYMARWHAVNWTRYHSLLHALAAMGHEVHVLQPPPLESLETSYQEINSRGNENILVHDVYIPNCLWKKRFFLDKLVKKAVYSIAAMGLVKSLIAKTKFDIVLLYNIPQFPLSQIAGPLVIFDYADDYIDMLEKELGALSNKPTLELASVLLTKMMKSADVVFSVSKELMHDAPVPMIVLPNGVNRAAFDTPVISSRRVVKSNGQKVVGFLGSFEYFIDFDIILEAARLCPHVHFLLVGTGRDFHRVSQKITSSGLSNVQLTGGVPHDQVFSYIQEMDICLNIFKPLPVSHRACPIKLFEYWSQRRPVISTRLAELTHVDKGWLYYADTGLELAETIHAILDDPATASYKADEAYNSVINTYTWENIAQTFLDHVASALRREPSSSMPNSHFLSLF